jgi:hypothetical protein
MTAKRLQAGTWPRPSGPAATAWNNPALAVGSAQKLSGRSDRAEVAARRLIPRALAALARVLSFLSGGLDQQIPIHGVQRERSVAAGERDLGLPDQVLDPPAPRRAPLHLDSALVAEHDQDLLNGGQRPVVGDFTVPGRP